MAQCKAATAAGSQCVSDIVAPSRSLCRRHQTVLTSGKPVVNFETGRKFPAPVVAAPAKATKKQATAPRAAATRSAPPARAPRAARVAAVAEDDDTPRTQRALGEHSLMCDGPRCSNMALPGSNYCMTHQRLA